MSICVFNLNFKIKGPVGIRGGNNPGASFEPDNAYRTFFLEGIMEKKVISTIRLEHGNCGQMVIVYDRNLTRKKVFGCFMALSECFAADDIDTRDFYTTRCIATDCEININFCHLPGEVA